MAILNSCPTRGCGANKDFGQGGITYHIGGQGQGGGIIWARSYSMTSNLERNLCRRPFRREGKERAFPISSGRLLRAIGLGRFDARRADTWAFPCKRPSTPTASRTPRPFLVGGPSGALDTSQPISIRNETNLAKISFPASLVPPKAKRRHFDPIRHLRSRGRCPERKLDLPRCLLTGRGQVGPPSLPRRYKDQLGLGRKFLPGDVD